MADGRVKGERMAGDLMSATDKAASLAELDDVVLRTAVDAEGATLPEGSYGTIVAVHNHGEAFTVEFVQPVQALALVKPEALQPVPGATRDRLLAATR